MLFYVYRKMEVWARWNHSFDMNLSYLASIQCFLILSSLRAHHLDGCNVMA